jgi:hypothetical protein
VSAPHQPFSEFRVAAFERFDDSHVITTMERAARSLCKIVSRRIARTWMNGFSMVFPIRCEPDSRMIA